MALTGVHVTCSFAGGSGRNGRTIEAVQKPEWSQTMAAPGTTAFAAPNGSHFDGEPLISVYPSMDIFVAIGPTPDAVNGPRSYVHRVDGQSVGGAGFFCKAGDKLAWIAA